MLISVEIWVRRFAIFITKVILTSHATTHPMNPPRHKEAKRDHNNHHNDGK